MLNDNISEFNILVDQEMGAIAAVNIWGGNFIIDTFPIGKANNLLNDNSTSVYEISGVGHGILADGSD